MLAKMTNQSPKFYGLTYVMLIPIFGIIYFILPSTSFGGALSNSMDSFLTCLYYSTVTITTLGYGDISAKSEIAQMLVIFETVLGVITIGLFLNSLSTQRSKELSDKEKEKEMLAKFKQECEKLFRHNKIIEQDIQFYLSYTYEITTPISIRLNSKLNRDFTFNDMKDLFKPSMRMTDNFHEPAVQHYFTHQKNLELSIKELILDVNFSYWRDLETECIEFLKNCKTYDFSSSILSLPNMKLGEEKSSDYASKMIENHTGEVKFLNSNLINQFVALYTLIKLNLKFLDTFQKSIKEINNNYV